MVDGSQTIAWVERRVGALTEAKIEARQAVMRHTVEEARERLTHRVQKMQVWDPTGTLKTIEVDYSGMRFDGVEFAIVGGK